MEPVFQPNSTPRWLHFRRRASNTPGLKIERYAEFVLEQWAAESFGGVVPVPVPVDVFGLARWLGVSVQFKSVMETSGTTSMSLERGEAVITIRTQDAEVHQRFSMAHELGHLMLEPKSGDYDRTIGNMTASERAANAFAANLLMPVAPMFSYSRQGADVYMMARQFNVSVTSMTYRMRNLELA